MWSHLCFAVSPFAGMVGGSQYQKPLQHRPQIGYCGFISHGEFIKK